MIKISLGLPLQSLCVDLNIWIWMSLVLPIPPVLCSRHRVDIQNTTKLRTQVYPRSGFCGQAAATPGQIPRHCWLVVPTTRQYQWGHSAKWPQGPRTSWEVFFYGKADPSCGNVSIELVGIWLRGQVVTAEKKNTVTTEKKIMVTMEKFGGNSGKKNKTTEKHTRQLVFATKKHTRQPCGNPEKHTRQLVFATKKHTRQLGKAYAATCICY